MAQQEGNIDDHSADWNGNDDDDHLYWMARFPQLQDPPAPQQQEYMPVTSAEAIYNQFVASPTMEGKQFTSHQGQSAIDALNMDLDLGTSMDGFTNPQLTTWNKPPAPTLPKELPAPASTMPLTSVEANTANPSTSQPLDMPGGEQPYLERLRICEAAPDKSKLEASMFALVEVSADLPAAEQAARSRANERFAAMRHQRRLEGNRRAARRSRLARENRLRDAENEAARLRAELAATQVERDALVACLPRQLLGLVRALADRLRRDRGLLVPEQQQLVQQQQLATATLRADDGNETGLLPWVQQDAGNLPAPAPMVGPTTTVHSPPVLLPVVEPVLAPSPDPAPEATAAPPSLLRSLITLPPTPSANKQE